MRTPPKRPEGIDPKTTPDSLRVTDPRRNQLIAYQDDRAAYIREGVLEGRTFRQIAKELGCSVYPVHSAWVKSCAAVRSENVEECRAAFDADFQATRPAMLEAAQNGDTRAFSALMRGYDVHARVMGYAAPEKKDVTVHSEATPAAARKLMQEIFGGNVGPRGEHESDGRDPKTPIQ